MRHRPGRKPIDIARIGVLLMIGLGGTQVRAAGDLEVTQLSLEDLLKIEVTSVSRKSQRLTDTAAAAFVLTSEDIQRSGANSIPDALRMVPGLDVAQVGASHWAVSARGFNGRFANKLLVLIDGRSVYSPLFSGVFWEAEDVMLDDLDRIEVIRGSGAALWGANAVNGVINIITKKSRFTQGTLVSASAGNEGQSMLAARYGGKVENDETFYRVWAKTSAEGDSPVGDDSAANDAARARRAGFRIDRDSPDGSRLNVTGNISRNTTGEVLEPATLVPPYVSALPVRQVNTGANLLGRYEWTLAGGSQATLQAYVDRTTFAEEFIDERRTTYDVDFQHRLVGMSRHDIIWGAGFRRSDDDIQASGVLLRIAPERRTYNLFSAFVHDQIELVPEKLNLIVGAKVEHNSYTNFELQPNFRMLWTPTLRDTLWGAVSRAARTPSRVERDATVFLQAVPPMSVVNPAPLPLLLESIPNRELSSEKVTAYELGYRSQLGSSLSVDVATFHNVYRGLRAGILQPPYADFSGPVPFLALQSLMANTLSATSSGVEVAADWHPTSWWRLQGGYTFLRTHARRNGDGANDFMAEFVEGTVPRHQVSLRSSMNLGNAQQFDVWIRRVGALTYSEVPAYTALDLRHAWHVTRRVELSLVGQNLLKARHAEFVGDDLPTKRLEVGRSVYAKLRWQF